jgi:hypothetical protein
LYELPGNKAYRDAGYAANRYVRCSLKVDGADEVRGAVKGSFPVYAGYDNRDYRGYGPYEYLNWACKFFIDSCLLEQKIRNNKDAQ